MAGYTSQRDVLLTHAKTAATTASSTFTNVAIGLNRPSGSKGCRLYFGGETDPATMGGRKTIDGGEMVGYRIMVAAWWALNSTSDATYKAIDDEVYAFLTAFRAAVVGDLQLGGTATSLSMEDATADIAVSGNARYLVIEIPVVADYVQYAGHV